jgi:hypothetical protein
MAISISKLRLPISQNRNTVVTVSTFSDFDASLDSTHLLNPKSQKSLLKHVDDHLSETK